MEISLFLALKNLFYPKVTNVPKRMIPQYADKPINMPVFNLFFLISDGRFFNISGI